MRRMLVHRRQRMAFALSGLSERKKDPGGKEYFDIFVSSDSETCIDHTDGLDGVELKQKLLAWAQSLAEEETKQNR